MGNQHRNVTTTGCIKPRKATAFSDGEIKEVQARAHLTPLEHAALRIYALRAQRKPRSQKLSPLLPVIEVHSSSNLFLYLFNCAPQSVELLGKDLKTAPTRIRFPLGTIDESEVFSGLTYLDLVLTGEPVTLPGPSPETGTPHMVWSLCDEPELTEATLREGSVLVHLQAVIDRRKHREPCWVSLPK